MKNVLVRSITGIIYIGIIVGAILGGQLWMFVLALLFSLIAIDEFDRITDRHNLPWGLRVVDIAGVSIMQLAVYALCIFDFVNFAAMAVAYIGYIIVRLVMPLYLKRGDQLAMTAHSFMGQVYVGLPLAMLLAAYFLSPAMVMLMFIMIWLNDTGAFCVGSLIGKHKLFERISPKKSWEGFFGGFFFSIAAGVVAALCFGDTWFADYSVVELAAFGAVVSVMSTWGDLVESQIKRTLGIKDSGNLLPGHGGILDRIDSLLLVAPATLAMLIILM